MWNVLAVIGGILLTAAITYYTTRRKNSGTVDTADAATIFAEGNSLRKELRDETVALRIELKGVREELGEALKENEISRQKIIKLMIRLKQSEAQVKKLQRKLKKLGA
jgi:uncharacterized protein (DUF3084 family)